MPDLKDAYGNYQAGLSPGPPIPGTYGSLHHGSGAPDAALGDIGDGYINVANGDWYTKKSTGWELQAGGGGGGANNLIGDVSPVGVELPDYEGQYYFNRIDVTFWVADGPTVNDWVQLV